MISRRNPGMNDPIAFVAHELIDDAVVCHGRLCGEAIESSEDRRELGCCEALAESLALSTSCFDHGYRTGSGDPLTWAG